MTVQFFRTPNERFANLTGYEFTPQYIQWNGLRMHYLDEGESNAPVALLLHGEPTWSYMYREWVAPLVSAGYRVIAPDHIGFGRSDKPIDDEWYVIERHCEALRHLIETLKLHCITLVVQDWGGPIGLRQMCDSPNLFDRVMIFNTWLHHSEFPYSDGARKWRQMATDPAQLGGDMPVGRIVAGTMSRPNHSYAELQRAYDAPFDGAISKAGARRFPWCLPFAEPAAGNALDQQRCRAMLGTLGIPIHIAFGDADPVFTWAQAEQWHAELPGSTIDRIIGASHFPQEDATEDCLEVFFRYCGRKL